MNTDQYEVDEYDVGLDLDKPDADSTQPPAPAPAPSVAAPAPAPADGSLSLAVRPHGAAGPKIALQVSDLDRGRLTAITELLLRSLLK